MKILFLYFSKLSTDTHGAQHIALHQMQPYKL
jgi:hypothetical protein